MLLAALIFAWPADAAPQAQAVQEVRAAPIHLRIGVTADGIVQLTPADLTVAGVDPAAIDPRTLALNSMGQPVAIRVTGDADGRFDQEDRVIFFGQKFRGSEFQEKYTDERVYWLDIGGDPGPRIAEIDATPQGDLTPPPDVAATARAEENAVWFPLWTLALVSITQDTWYWARLRPTAMQPITVMLDNVVPDPAPGTGSDVQGDDVLGLFQCRRAARASQCRNPQSGAPAGSDVAGHMLHQLTASVPSGSLVSGLNSVAVGVTCHAGQLHRSHLCKLLGDRLPPPVSRLAGSVRFRAEATGTHEYVIGNWTSKHVTVLDVADPAQPRRLTGVVPALEGAGKTQLRFRTEDGPGARYWLQEDAAIQPPASIRRWSDTGLRDPARRSRHDYRHPGRVSAGGRGIWRCGTRPTAGARSLPTCRMCTTSSTRASRLRQRPSQICCVGLRRTGPARRPPT